MMLAAQGAMGARGSVFPLVFQRDGLDSLFLQNGRWANWLGLCERLHVQLCRKRLVQKIISGFVSGGVWPARIPTPRDDFRHPGSVSALDSAGKSCAAFHVLGKSEY